MRFQPSKMQRHNRELEKGRDTAKKVTIIGATGSIGRTVTEYLLEHTEDAMVLFARSANRIRKS